MAKIEIPHERGVRKRELMRVHHTPYENRLYAPRKAEQGDRDGWYWHKTLRAMYERVLENRGGQLEKFYTRLVCCWNDVLRSYPDGRKYRYRCGQSFCCPRCYRKRFKALYYGKHLERVDLVDSDVMFATLTVPLGFGYDNSERFAMARLGLAHLLKKINKKQCRAAKAISAGMVAYDFCRKVYRNKVHINCHLHMLIQVEAGTQQTVRDWIERTWCKYTAAEYIWMKPLVPREGDTRSDAFARSLRYLMDPYELDRVSDLVEVQGMIRGLRRIRSFGSFVLR